jgi:hypothetical protein
VRTAIGPFTTLTARQQLTPTPYAITASNLTGTLPAGQLSGALPSANLVGTYSAAVTLNNVGNNFSGSGAGLTGLNAGNLASGTVPDARLASNVARTNQVWLLGGNSGTTPGTHFLGTTDNKAFEVKVNGRRALRFEPNSDNFSYSNTVTVVLGSPLNSGSGGAAIGGGGGTINGFAAANTVGATMGTVAGGARNTVDTGFAGTIGGGFQNMTGGGADAATVGGGWGNRVGDDAPFATISGGNGNEIRRNGDYGTIAGGSGNTATNHAFAAGRRAKADHTGAFVWADSTAADFSSTAANQFLIRAEGGVGIGTEAPNAQLHVRGDGVSPSLRVQVNSSSKLTVAANGGTAIGVFNDTPPADGLYVSGDVGIGRAPAANTLEVNGTASKSTAGDWLANSDARIKQSVETVTSALDTLNKVRLVSFRYTDDYRAQHKGIEDRRYLNVIAQEFREVFPEHVKSSGEKLPDGSDILQVDIHPLTIYSAAAVQELNTKLNAQTREMTDGMKKVQAKLSEKETEIAELKQRIEALEKAIRANTITSR